MLAISQGIPKRTPFVKNQENTMENPVVVQHLDVIAAKARKGLRKVAEGEDTTMEGWLIYGAALNEGREQFDGDREFGEWVALCQLDTADRHDRAAAMWAAANPEDFKATKKANPRVRTVRGLHAKWKTKDKPQAKIEPTEDDLKTMGRLQTLAERGATDAERESAKVKLEAYASAFGDSKEEAVERAKQAQAQEVDDERTDQMLEAVKRKLRKKGDDWLAEQLIWAMAQDQKIFMTIAKRVNQ